MPVNNNINQYRSSNFFWIYHHHFFVVYCFMTFIFLQCHRLKFYFPILFGDLYQTAFCCIIIKVKLTYRDFYALSKLDMNSARE